MKNYPHILSYIDASFGEALNKLKSDPLFSSNQTIYTEDDKVRIATYWKDIVEPFLELRKIIRSLMWRSFFTFGSKNSFVVKYSAIVTYYTMIYKLRQSFGPHEEFLRQYLDDTFRENYSTLARYMYHTRFIAILLYPYEYFLSLQDEVDKSLAPLFEREVQASHHIEQRFTLDLINIWYYIRFRISLLLSWMAKHGGRLMMHLRFSRRTHGLIKEEHLHALLTSMKPGDILVTRQNWVATNLNIPGFWKHMAMYIGTGDSINMNFPEYNHLGLHGSTHYIIEAIGVGVQVIPIETLCSHNDYLGVLRMRFSESKIQRAIGKTLSLIGRAYDYSFNYYSDMNYVCSTLVTKAYLPESQNDEGIHITLTRIGTGITYPPNDLVRKFASENTETKKELEFVGFIDSEEKTGENFLSTEEAFLQTYNRSKLSFFLR